MRLEWENLATVNNLYLYFQNITLSKHFDYPDLFPKNDDGYLLPILIKRTVGIYCNITVVATRVTKEKRSGQLTSRCAHVTMLWPGNSFGANWAFKLTTFVYSSLIYFHHNRMDIDSSISVSFVTLTTWEAYLGLWWASQVVNETTVTSILMSSPKTQ